MKNFIKKNLLRLPMVVRFWFVFVYESYYALLTFAKLSSSGINVFMPRHKKNIKPRILFYHPFGLSFSGTAKFLQVVAKYLDKEKYDVYFFCSMKDVYPGKDDFKLDSRLEYLKNQKINIINFDFIALGKKYPYIIDGAKPNIYSIVRESKIDLLVIAGSGYAEFPINLIRKLPIVILNIFGSFNVQKNIVKNVCISNAVADKIKLIVPEDKIEVMYVPSEGPIDGSVEAGMEIRKRFGIKDDEMVFGRIGRASDAIFDPIGINAFKKLVKERQDVHYIIMSPADALIKIVNDEQIANVHFLPPSGREEDVWAFHQSIDCVAHFRKDGESCGLNIAESMLCGKPVISHCSTIWNAHSEYLLPEFSRVADVDDVDGYYMAMKKFVEKKRTGELARMGELAKAQAEKLFLIDNSIKDFEKIIDNALQK